MDSTLGNGRCLGLSPQGRSLMSAECRPVGLLRYAPLVLISERLLMVNADVWRPLSQTPQACHFQTLQCRPLPRRNANFPQHLPLAHRYWTPARPPRAPSLLVAPGLLHLLWPYHRERPLVSKPDFRLKHAWETCVTTCVSGWNDEP